MFVIESVTERLCAASCVVCLLFGAPAAWAQTPPSQVTTQESRSTSHAGGGDETSGADLMPFGPALVGTWKAPTERLPLTGDFNEKVWGKNAVSVRDITMTVKPSGDATLTIARKVLDARGRVVPGSSSVEEATVTIGAARPGFATRLDHEVTVVKAERRYPDDVNDRWPLDNLRVGVVTFTDGRDTMEVRFDPSDGQGAFAEMLTRQGTVRRTARR